MEAALKYGYRPNANAVRLATGRAGAIGVVMGRSGGGHFFSEFMGGMATRLEQEETDILVSVTVDNNLDEEPGDFQPAGGERPGGWHHRAFAAPRG